MKASFAAEGKRLEREHDERAWLAWHIAALMRTNPKKRLQKLESMQVKKSVAARVQQSWQQMMGIMDVFAARSKRHAAALKAMGK